LKKVFDSFLNGGGKRMNGAGSKSVARQAQRAVLTAVAVAALLLPPAGSFGQRRDTERPAPRNAAPRQQGRPAYTRPEAPRQQNQGRPAQPYPNRAPQQYPNRMPQQYPNRSPQQYQNQTQRYPNRTPQQYQPYRGPGGTQPQRPIQAPYAPQAGARGGYPNSNFNGRVNGRQPYPGTAQQLYAPPGHLGAWLNTHRNVPVPQQQQMLRSDPSFRQLPQGEQQRVMNQLNRVNEMPNAQRERTLARAENLERLSPEDRARVAQSARQWTSLPPDRQTMMRNAFRDLKAVPPDQRSIVLNSSRYQNQFNTQERGILSNMLQVEPYAPPR
jgi:hypothetical protein